MSNRPAIVLVHGGWLGSWYWQPVRGILEGRGWRVETVDLPTVHSPQKSDLGMQADADTVATAISAIDGPVVVVGHSYGGVPVTQAATSSTVKHIVYLAAFALDEGESVLAALGGEVPEWWIVDNGHVTPAPVAPPAGAPPLEGPAAAMVDQLNARTTSQSLAAYTDTLTQVAWRDHKTTYVITTADELIPVPVQEMFAARAGSAVEHIASGHFPMLSHPDEIANLLERVAEHAAVTP